MRAYAFLTETLRPNHPHCKTARRMKGNIPIPELHLGEETWLTAVVSPAREKRSTVRKPFYIAFARNSTGSIPLVIWDKALGGKRLRPGLWGIIGRLEIHQNQAQFSVTECKPISIEVYETNHKSSPPLPKAYTIDVETIAQPSYEHRVSEQLKRAADEGVMKADQLERYIKDPVAELRRSYKLGGLQATSGRILSIALHVGTSAGVEIEGNYTDESEHVFGITGDGKEQQELEALSSFVNAMTGFEPEFDEIVGHNIINFDIPFIFQRCLAHGVSIPAFFNLGDYNVRGIFDTMHRWWLGARRSVKLDEIAWALDLESSKSEEIDGSRVFDLYHAGRLSDIREYNLRDVRLTRKVYDLMAWAFGR
jgi:hypothetical protein